GGIIAINLRDGDELVSAMLIDAVDDSLLVSRKGMSLRFTADDTALRPMGRATSGVKGMSFRTGDRLLSANALRAADGDGAEAAYVFVATERGYAKSTAIDEYRTQGRGGIGIKVAKLREDRGDLAGALVVGAEDEVL